MAGLAGLDCRDQFQCIRFAFLAVPVQIAYATTLDLAATGTPPRANVKVELESSGQSSCPHVCHARFVFL
jgi:hypothetical protein